ncbi:protein yellow [Cimex lectularius]|uniref:Protein yellow n=1 Tax=Cimex lectularius TaxID=79782 RepID=A0A8I6SJN6_CIMLE|nr:protein yellow [Cimex lectularius]XP_014260020.1 protein yellow [Cimex lectularius]
MWTIRVLTLLGSTLVALGSSEKMKEVFKWKQVDYAFPNEAARNMSVTMQEFKQRHNLPLGIEIWNDKVFVTVPRWRSGVPSSLNYVKLNSGESPLLVPYPDWETNNITSKPHEEKIVSTFRVRADECDRLWVIDSGLADLLEAPQLLTPPKLMVYDLKTDKLLRVYPLKPTDAKAESFFANIVVDVSKDKCDEANAYLADLGNFGLVVYDWKTNDSWRVQHHFFYFDPLAGNYNIGGVNFQWNDGLFGIALGPNDSDGHRTMYFHPLSSTREFAVSTKIVKNKSIASESYYEYKILGSRGPDSQATTSFLDEKSGVLFYTQVNKDGIGCWNSLTHRNDYSADTNGLVASDNQTMVFPNDLKIDRNRNLWVITDRLPAFIYRQLDPEEVNFRILMAPVDELVKGTVCDNVEKKAQ